MSTPYASVVIPTFNRAGLLARILPALVDQQTDGLAYEVIFVSNGSTDQTDTVLKEAVTRHPEKLRYYYIAPTGGPAAPRNTGIRAARGDVVIILDDDVLPEPGLVLTHMQFHKSHPEPSYAALGEAYVPRELQDDPMSLFHAFPYDKIRHFEGLDYLHFWTCNVSVKRQFMLQAGMFDESFLAYEDVLCGYRLAESGMSLHFVPSARGKHLHQLKPEGIPAKGLWYGRWLYAVLQSLPDSAAKERFGVLSWDIGPWLLFKRVLRRGALHMAANSVSMACLRALGATRCRRNRLTDLYYYTLFRRNVIAGYSQAKREARRAGRLVIDKAISQWVDRGEP